MSLRSSRLLLSVALMSIHCWATAVQAEPTGYKNAQLLTSTEELVSAVGDGKTLIVDVRTGEAYKKGHIPGAVLLSADDVSDPGAHVAGAHLPVAKLAKLFGKTGISKNTPVILYDDQGGFLAARIFWLLEYLGHRKVSILNGGITAWTDQGHRLSRKLAKVKRKRFTPTITPRRSASADWILERQQDPTVVVIDVRPANLFAKGHIPWARNISWKRNLSAGGTMKSASALKNHFLALGVTPDKNIAVHCQNGKASAHSYFALRLLGYPRVRTYDRSWAEWGTADDLPKATADKG